MSNAKTPRTPSSDGKISRGGPVRRALSDRARNDLLNYLDEASDQLLFG